MLVVAKEKFDKEQKEQSIVLSFALKLAQVAGESFSKIALQLLAILGAFGLWLRILDKPDSLQLGALGLYGLFVLLPTFFWRKPNG